MKVIRLTKKGLSLIELMLSITIIAIISGITIPMVEQTVNRKKEEKLIDNLMKIRNGIDKFYMSKHRQNPKLEEWEKYPSNLKILVEEKILRRIPMDPFTGKREYEFIFYENLSNNGLFDIRSKSDKLSSRGDLYSSW